MSDRFQKVEENLATWSPRMKGSKKENNLVKLEANEKSWIIGWYLGFRKFTAKEGGDEYTVHKMKAFEIGDPSTASDEISKEGTVIEFFGSGVLDRMLAENIQPGQAIRVMWLGLVAQSDNVKRAYHGWQVDVDTETTPISVMNGVIVGDAQSSNNDVAGFSETVPQGEAAESVPANTTEGAPADPDDDLPF